MERVTRSSRGKRLEKASRENNKRLITDMLPAAAKKHSLPQTPVKLKKTVSLFTPRSDKSSQANDLKTPTSSLSRGRSALRRTHDVGGSLVGRIDEKKAILNFLTRHIELQQGAFMLATGPPGTGKTIVIEHCLRNIEASHTNIRILSINCMRLSNATELIDILQTHFQISLVSNRGRDKKLEPQRPQCVLFLDEIDQLMSHQGSRDIVHQIVVLALTCYSGFICIGAANVLNMVDDHNIPFHLCPKRVAKVKFGAYSSDQILTIIRQRLMEHDFVLFDAAAIQMCAKKVAGGTGDIRLALDICRVAMDLVEFEQREKSSSPKTRQKRTVLGDITCMADYIDNISIPQPRVQIGHIIRAFNSINSGQTKLNADLLKSSSVHQKATLCLLVAMDANTKEVTVDSLFDEYTAVCMKHNMLDPLRRVEFQDVLGALETSGAISMQENRNKRSASLRVKPRLAKIDVMTAVAGVSLLSHFLMR